MGSVLTPTDMRLAKCGHIEVSLRSKRAIADRVEGLDSTGRG